MARSSFCALIFHGVHCHSTRKFFLEHIHLFLVKLVRKNNNVSNCGYFVEDFFQFGQLVATCENECGLCLIDAISKSVHAKRGVQSDHGNLDSEAGKGAHQPLGPCFGKENNFLARFKTNVEQAIAEVHNPSVHISQAHVLIVSQRVLFENFSIRLHLVVYGQKFSHPQSLCIMVLLDTIGQFIKNARGLVLNPDQIREHSGPKARVGVGLVHSLTQNRVLVRQLRVLIFVRKDETNQEIY
ncbi:hypothetical protein BpHYR1_013922 [Brachionus plicatilis]|uniref:Uncharacterized protein n=1 Tax=Brachionus plicatilis TaxID=10195 RepID=A0A3M7R495_BRAPC|nr:hypothetical protein BpHYR1_013922 [Brachionus plicatilis]